MKDTPMDLEFTEAFHLRGEVVLAKGQRLTLRALHQWLTYGGLLEGRPSREWNNRIVAESMREAEKFCANQATPVLVPPVRSPYLRDPSENAKNREFYRYDPEWLPVVTCVGIFWGPVARDQRKHIGVLPVVWFQSEYAPPIAEPAARWMRDLDWVALATDLEF